MTDDEIRWTVDDPAVRIISFVFRPSSFVGNGARLKNDDFG